MCFIIQILSLSLHVINVILCRHRLRVKLGGHKRSDGSQEIDVSKIILHEKYDPSPNITNDIALLKLAKKYKNDGSYKDLCENKFSIA